MAEETQCTAAWRDGAGFDAPSMIVGSVAGALISAALFGWVMRWRGSRQGKAAPAPSATSAKNGGSGTLELLDSDLESGGSEDEEEEEEEEYKMVMCVNMDLKMGKGKIAAQCCHACLGSFRRAPEKYVRPWARSGQPKIAVKCKDVSELEDLAATAQELNLPYYLVADAGRTQIAAGSRTVCAIGPAPKEVIDLITGHLKLL